MVWKLNVYIYISLGRVLRLDIPKHQSFGFGLGFFTNSFLQPTAASWKLDNKGYVKIARL